MPGSDDRIVSQVGCLDTERLVATLIPATGYHCEVWKSLGALIHNRRRQRLEIIIKLHYQPCRFEEIRLYALQYRKLRQRLGEIVPQAEFVATEVNGQPSVIVIAEAVYPWFNLANPANEEETIELLCRTPRARDQLDLFLSAARHWYDAEDARRVIDLYGLDNLVLDKKTRELRYVDSFEVFFNEDLLDLLPDPDAGLIERITLSLRRLEYLNYVLAEIDKRRRRNH